LLYSSDNVLLHKIACIICNTNALSSQVITILLSKSSISTKILNLSLKLNINNKNQTILLLLTFEEIICKYFSNNHYLLNEYSKLRAVNHIVMPL